MNFASVETTETSSGRNSYFITFYTDGELKRVGIYRTLKEVQIRSIDWEVKHEWKTWCW